MSLSAEKKAQSSFEAIVIAALVIILATYLASHYFGDTSEQTTAIIIVKTEFLKALSGIDKSYVIVSSLEPKLLDNGTLCFSVKTRPPDLLVLPNNGIDAIKSSVSSKTKYKAIDIKLNSGDC